MRIESCTTDRVAGLVGKGQGGSLQWDPFLWKEIKFDVFTCMVIFLSDFPLNMVF